MNGENYASLSLVPGTPMIATMSDGVSVSYDPSAPVSPEPADPQTMHLKELSRKITPAARVATDAYRAAHDGQPPPSPDVLVPYFANPQDGADFVEFLEAVKQAQTGNPPGR